MTVPSDPTTEPAAPTEPAPEVTTEPVAPTEVPSEPQAAPADPSQSGQTQQEVSTSDLNQPTADVAAAPAVSEPAPPVVPADGFHDTREVDAAAAGGLPTQEGVPLTAAAQEILRGLNQVHDEIAKWVDYGRGILAKATAIGSGQ